MNLRDQLARVIARDSRYSIEAYAFVLESLKLARNRKLKEQRRARITRDRSSPGRRKWRPRNWNRRSRNRATCPAVSSRWPPAGWR